MIGPVPVRRLLAASCTVGLTATGCAFGGVNSFPLPGAVGRGSGSSVFHVEIANVSTLDSNSPVTMGDVVIGSVGKMTVHDWHADVEVFVTPGVAIPANAVAMVGQTSLLGSMHLELNPPIGEKPTGHLPEGATIPLNDTSTYPSTEKTLSSLSALVNGGGLGQIGDIIHNFNAALSGRQNDFRELLTRLDKFVATFDAQRDNLVASVNALNRLAGTFAVQRDVVDRALKSIPAALKVLIEERPQITTALKKLRDFSDTATGLVNDTQEDLVNDLRNLGPTIGTLADVGPNLDRALAYATVFPYGQTLIDRGVRGDYMNQYAVVDLTIPRLKGNLFLGTRWGQEGASLVPAPGDPLYYTVDPLGTGTAASPLNGGPSLSPGGGQPPLSPPPAPPALAPLPSDDPAAPPAEVPVPPGGSPPVENPPAGRGG